VPLGLEHLIENDTVVWRFFSQPVIFRLSLESPFSCPSHGSTKPNIERVLPGFGRPEVAKERPLLPDFPKYGDR
jgi:hypothetical protein